MTLFAMFTLATALLGGGATVNVRDFGAVGDGVHDDTLAIQRAADSVYSNGEWRIDRDWIYVRSRYSREGKDGATKEVFFPKGTYRITGPVMFSYPVLVRGEKGAVIRNDDPSKESFYFHLSYQMRISGLVFIGGRNQIRVFESNDTGPVVISDCRFQNASGTSVFLDSLILNDGVNYGSGAGKRPDCSPYEIERGKDGRVILKDRPAGSMRLNYSSALQVIENCKFVDNAHAIYAHSDSLIIRDCDFKAPRTASGAVVHAHCQAHLNRLRIFVERNPKLEQYAVEVAGIVISMSDVSIASDGDLTAIRSCGYAYRSSIATVLKIKDLKLNTGSGSVIRFVEDRFPALVSLHGVTAGKQCKKGQRLFEFEVEPTPERFEKWYGRAVANANCPIPRMADEASYAVVVEDVDERHFDASLPPILEKFRRQSSRLIRRDSERFSREGEGDFGQEITVSGIGTELNSARNKGDTELLEHAVAEATAKGAATIVLPGKWIKLERPIRLSGKVKVMGRGLAFITGMSDKLPIFEIADGAEVWFENIVFHRARNAIRTDAGSGRVRMKCYAFYDQAEESIYAVHAGGGSRLRIECTAGNGRSHNYYCGNATMVFDGTQLNLKSNYTLDDYKAKRMPQSYKAYVNLPGGRLEMHDILCTPWFFEHVHPMRAIAYDPEPWQMGDFRYIDNYGELKISNFRFGGEWGGLTPVYQYGKDASVYIEGGYEITTCCRLKAGAAVVLADREDSKAVAVELGTSNFREQIPAYGAWRGEDGELRPLKSFREENTFPFAMK